VFEPVGVRPQPPLNAAPAASRIANAWRRPIGSTGA